MVRTTLLALALFAACAPADEPAPDPDPDPAASTAVVYTNATVITLDEAQPTATGLRIDGDRITHVFDGAVPEGLDGRVVDLEGAVVLPGLVDAHLHLRGIGAASRQLDLKGTESAGQIAVMVTDAAAAAPAGTWIRGRGWDQNDWAVQEFPDTALLDAAAPDHPVWLTRVDGHAVWLNQRALDLAQITIQTVDPEGGEILRGEDGTPTGVLVDNAISLASDQLPTTSAEGLKADYERAIGLAHSVGLVGVHDMGTAPRSLAVLRDLEAAGALNLNVAAYLSNSADGTDTAIAQGPDKDGLLQVRGVKMFVDGALGSRGAALLAPYADRPETSGLLMAEADALLARASEIQNAGLTLAIHAIGDRGNRVALDLIEQTQGESRPGHRIEHAQIVDLADLPRFAASGVTASMQPTHATSDMPWAPARLGPDRLDGAYAWRRMLTSGALLAFGSDAPVEGYSPWLGIYAAVTRADAAGEPAGGWLPDQKLTVLEALEGFTSAPWRAIGVTDAGRIAPGQGAHLTVVDRDPRTVPPEALLETQTLRTIVAGAEVYLGP
ncbi:MAG: amidohydrolase [Proteobacteria bacterium]|nr:amidohydrolase [Pseudomonadota bacterium]